MSDEERNNMGEITLFHGTPEYNQRDVTARRKMKEFVDSDANKVTNVFSTLLER